MKMAAIGKRKLRVFFQTLILFIFLLPGGAIAEEGNGDSHVLAPYFHVNTPDALMPLKKTSALVTVAGVIADVTVIQQYKNEGKQPIEAVYIFPGSTRAAVHAMKMRIGERVIEAKIKEKQAAKITYESAKSEGKSAALLEQERPNVFKMNVANILPGDDIKVELSYTELLVPTDGTYEFVYPTVVGPRYSNKRANEAPESEKWVEHPYMEEGSSRPYAFDFALDIVGGMPIQEISSPSHEFDIDYPDPNSAKLVLDDKNGGNRDVVVRYRFEGQKIQTGAMLYQGMDENFFLLMLEPPAKPQPSDVPPREYVFVIDVSGSMHGFPLTVAKGLMFELLQGLKAYDRFNVLLFSGGYSTLAEQSIEATPENIRKALELIDSNDGRGSTELLPALKHALQMPRTDGTSTSIVVVTDGYVNVETEAFDLIRSNLGKANLFSFGIGSSVNRHLIEGMARAGLGEPAIVLNLFGSKSAAQKFREYIETPVLTDIKVDYEGASIHDVEPANIPDLFAERPLVIFGKWGGKKKGIIRVTGRTGGSVFEQTIDLSKLETDSRLHALSYLWARNRITTLSDYNSLRFTKEAKEEIIKVGLKYNLMTEFTSFVAVDEIIRNKTNELKTVKQPLPLPQGVSNLAVGFVGTSPEPGTYLIIGLLGAMLMLFAVQGSKLPRRN